MSHIDGLVIFSKVPPINLKKEWTSVDFNSATSVYPDTKEYYAAGGYYNDIVKQTTPSRGSRRESEKAEISLAVVALEELYHSPTFDPRVDFFWYNALLHLSDHEHAVEVLAALQRKMVVPSVYLANLLHEIQEHLRYQRKLVEKEVEAEKLMGDTQFLHRYSSEAIKKHVFPKATICNIDACLNLFRAGSEATHSKLVCYIALDTHRIEGDLTQIDNDHPGLTSQLLSLGFSYSTLKNLKISDQTHVLSVLRTSYDLLLKVLVEYSENARVEKRLNMTAQKLFEIHAELFKPFLCTIMGIYDSENGKFVPRFGVTATRRFKFYPNSTPMLKNPMPQFCPPASVETDLKLFFKLLDEHLSRNREPFLVAAWAHHFFNTIHPFQHGNLRIARILATIVLCRYNLLPLLIRLEDEAQYKEAISEANTGNIVDLANFFASMQVQALMITVAQEETTKKPSSKHEMCVQIAIDTAQAYFAQNLTTSVVELSRFKNGDWSDGIPFPVGRKNSFCLELSRVKDKASYARLLFGPLKPWRNGNLAVYLQDMERNTMQLTCINLLSPNTVSSEMEAFLEGSQWFLEDEGGIIYD